MLRIFEERAKNSRILLEKLVGNRKEPFVIAGTNVLDQDGSIAMDIARHVKGVCDKHKVECVFKASFDKANRTNAGAFRGPGLERGLEILQSIKKETGLPILTDVHETNQVGKVAMVADILQIPSLLCRQTDLIQKAGDSGRLVNIKRGQFASPFVMKQAAAKVNDPGRVLICERGTMYGLNDIVMDPKQVIELKKLVCDSNIPIVIDVSHAAQIPPNDVHGKSHGQRDLVPIMANIAAVLGADGIFVELYPDDQIQDAPVDSNVQLHLSKFEKLLQDVLKISKICVN